MLAVAIVAACAVAVSCGKRDESTSRSAAPQSTGTNAAGAPAVRPEFARLVGKWKRSELGYVLEIKGVDSGGTVEAAYFIPKPVHVARAAAVYKDGTTRVFLELRDENFPGCTYSLIYNPASDQLFGQYYQAAFKMGYKVTFARQK